MKKKAKAEGVRNTVVYVRLTERERDAVREAAKRAKRSVGEWARLALLAAAGGAVVVALGLVAAFATGCGGAPFTLSDDMAPAASPDNLTKSPPSANNLTASNPVPDASSSAAMPFAIGTALVPNPDSAPTGAPDAAVGQTPTCVPKTCAQAGVACGQMWDSCGSARVIDCPCPPAMVPPVADAPESSAPVFDGGPSVEASVAPEPYDAHAPVCYPGVGCCGTPSTVWGCIVPAGATTPNPIPACCPAFGYISIVNETCIPLVDPVKGACL